MACSDHAAAAEVDRAVVHLLPEPADLEWVLADEQRAEPEAILCEAGASITALATERRESISPMPTMPSSVWTRTIRASWLPSAIAVLIAAGWRWIIASTLVIFIGFTITP